MECSLHESLKQPPNLFPDARFPQPIAGYLWWPTPPKTAYSSLSSTGRIASAARYRLHPDWHEADGVFTLEEFRGH